MSKKEMKCPQCKIKINVLALADDIEKTTVYVSNDARLPPQNLDINPDKNTLPENQIIGEVPRYPAASGARARSTGPICDVCYISWNPEAGTYCHQCKQKLCDLCDTLHKNFAASHGHHTQELWPVRRIIQQKMTETFIAKTGSINNVAELIATEIGIQTCVNFRDRTLEICGPFTDIVDLAELTLQRWDEDPPIDNISIRIKKGHVEWIFYGDNAKIVQTMFKEELGTLTKAFHNVKVVASTKRNKDTMSSDETICNGSIKLINDLSKSELVTDKFTYNTTAKREKQLAKTIPSDIHSDPNTTDIPMLQIQCNFEDYVAVASAIDDIVTEMKDLDTEEIVRPKRDKFRMKIYAMMKDADGDVLCTEANVDNTLKLVIRGRNSKVVQDTKQAFLSLFCKECSVCHSESLRPLFLDCKHVLCQACVTHSVCLDNSMQCQVCSARQDSPVKSLHLQCIQLIDEVLDTNSRAVKASWGRSTHRKAAYNRQQMSAKLPKYLLKKWTRTSGGLQRLKSLIENNYGLQVAGSEDNLKIYGNQQEILELAVHSIETLNEKTSETSVSRRITDKSVEWRFRGGLARIVRFLFNNELFGLPKKFKTVSVNVFTESSPSVVDIKCDYQEYVTVKYEIDELENAARTLHEDEFIQPKTFYYNIKVKEFIQSKKRDDKVFCELNEKDNLNVIIIKARKKSYISIAKIELSNW